MMPPGQPFKLLDLSKISKEEAAKMVADYRAAWPNITDLLKQYKRGTEYERITSK